MKLLTANKSFTFKGKYYELGEEITNVDSFEEVRYLNENGFIKPLTRKELESFFEEKDIKKDKELL